MSLNTRERETMNHKPKENSPNMNLNNSTCKLC